MHLILLGAPGSGKGTAAADLIKIYGIPHISTGDMFREAIKNQTELGKIAKELIDNGKFVPDEVTCGLVKDRLSMDDCKKGFLLDGFPRNLNQADKLNEILAELGMKLDATIDLDVDHNLIVQRIVNRRLCPDCGASYNLITMPPKKDGVCDNCGAKLIQRKDDNEETIKTRLAIYSEQTEPLIEYYKNKNLLISIDSNHSAEHTTKLIVEALKKFN